LSSSTRTPFTLAGCGPPLRREELFGILKSAAIGNKSSICLLKITDGVNVDDRHELLEEELAIGEDLQKCNRLARAYRRCSY
jgi:hypothetical protein